MSRTELSDIYVPSSEIVARMIEGELLIVPLAAGIGDMEDELFTLNNVGRAIWERLDGMRTLGEIATELATEFSAEAGVINRDVIGFAKELARRKIIVCR